MKALIMAAGIGSRISRHLSGQPKCCVKVGDIELIKYSFQLLKNKGVEDIAIVTGYSDQYILEVIKEFEYTGFKNYFFDVTNSIASLWFAQEFLSGDDDMIIMNADVFIEEKIIDVLLQETMSPVFLSDSSRIAEADYKFNWSNNQLLDYGKQLTVQETTGEYVGIAKIAKTDIDFMQQRLNELISQQKHHYWWEDIFYRSLDLKTCYIKDIKGLFWAEVDYIEDYERIQDYLANKKLNPGS